MAEIRSRNLQSARAAYDSSNGPDSAASARAHRSPSIEVEAGHTPGNDINMAINSGILKQATRGTLFSIILVALLHPIITTTTLLLQTISSFAAISGLVLYFISLMDHTIKISKYDHERKREAWELRNYPKGEIDEIIELFEGRGVSSEDATYVVQRMAKYDEFFVDLMMAEELMMVKPLSLESTPLRFVYEGVSFGMSTCTPVIVAVLLKQLSGDLLQLSLVTWCHSLTLLQFIFCLFMYKKIHKLKLLNIIIIKYGSFAFVVTSLWLLVYSTVISP